MSEPGMMAMRIEYKADKLDGLLDYLLPRL